MDLDIGIAASAREWPDRLHRHVLDHGGARVSGRLMGVTQCLESSCDVVLIDDVCSFLTPRLITVLRQKGRSVIGVFDPADAPDAKRRLLECGITDVIESQASAEEFLELASSVSDVVVELALSRPHPTVTAKTVGVVGVSDGVGTTELAVNLARSASRKSAVCLVDLDALWPSIAQRLDLPAHPNLRSLADAVFHGGTVEDHMHRWTSMSVVTGAAWQRSGSPLAHHEVTMILESLAENCDLLVADLGSEDRCQAVILRGLDVVILVAAGDPISLTRLVKVTERLDGLFDRGQLVAAINETPRRRFHRGEIRSEMATALPGLPMLVLPFDKRVPRAIWDGRPTPRGPFTREVERIADLVAAGTP